MDCHQRPGGGGVRTGQWARIQPMLGDAADICRKPTY